MNFSSAEAVQVEETPHPLSTLCGREFWNVTVSWEADLPDMGLCMERTVLIWIPCLLLWLLSPLYIVILQRKGFNYMPWTCISITKIAVSAFLIVAAATELVWSVILSNQGILVPTNEFLAPTILLLSYVFHAYLVQFGRQRGDQSSGLIYCFWVLMVFCGIPQVITTIHYTIQKDDRLHVLMAVTFLLQYVGAVVLLIVNTFSDRPPDSRYFNKSQTSFPRKDASFISKVTFQWANGIVWQGYKTPLSQDDMWDLPSKVSTLYLDRKWDAAMQRELASKQKKRPSDSPSVQPKLSVLNVTVRTFFWPGLFACILNLVAESMVFATPRLISVLIGFTTNDDEPAWHGYFYSVLLLLITFLTTIVRNVFYFMNQTMAARVRSTLMSAVYRKALILSSTSRRESTLGEIVNLMSIDSHRLADAVLYTILVSSSPFTISIAFFELWQLLGPSVLAGVALLILLIPVNSIVANQIKIQQGMQMKYKDKRIKLLTEIINGIKVLKLYAWEGSFAKQVDALRNDEVRVLRKSAYFQAFSNFLFLTTPYLVALATFTTFLLVSKENVLDAKVAFVAISLINIMRIPINFLPQAIAMCIQGSVALKRLGKFLGSANLDLSSVCQDKDESSAIVVRGGYFSWGAIEGEDEPWKLKDVDMEVAHGKLVAVVGSVGSGKSSLISALLGEMQKEAGRVVVNGSVAYVSQQAWLQNATLRDNITWGEGFDAEKYQKVIDACALQPDLDMLPGGDMTEIGEKGLNLSGGQKQRVSLARATYSNADIILLDDPLSAVDAHVGRHIFDNLIGPKGLMKDKTRILVTHAVWLLPQMDEIFVVRDGSLVEKGTYTQLLSQGGNFSQFLLQHINKSEDDDSPDAADELNELFHQLEELPSGQELLRQLSQMQSSVNDEDESSSRRCQLHGSAGSIRHQSEGDNEKTASTKSLRKTSLALDKNKPVSGKILVQEEKREKGRVKWKVYQFYIMAMGLIPALLPILFYSLAQASQAGGNIWLSKFSSPNTFTNNNSTLKEFDRTEFLLGYGGLGIGQALFFYFGALLTWTGTMLAGKKIHQRLLDNVLHLPMSFFDTNPSGRVMNRMSKEIDVLDSVLPISITSGISSLIQVVTTLIVIIGSTPVVAFVIIPMMVVYFFVQKVFIATARQIKRIESIAKSPIYSFFSESLQGVSTIRAFKKNKEFISLCQKKIDYGAKAFMTNLATNRWLLVRLECLGNCMTFAAAIFAVAGRGNIDPGIVGLSITYALNVTFSLNWLVRMTAEIEANIVSVERIQEYIEEEQEAPWSIKGNEPSKLWPDRGCVTFSNYQARYRPGLELVVKGITCKINPGEKVGIVGRTGAGKSSLTLGLFRIIEAAGGSVEIDGVNISKIGLHDLRGRLTIIPQDPVLFSGTLRINLDPFATFNDDAVWQALENAHLKDYVKAQTGALQTVIDEGGSNLSVGQRQLVCLARALLRKSQILVLDEATAAVDLDTDDLIQATIRREFADCTIITIAHRLNNIMDSDRILVMDKGKIAEFCSPEDLLANEDSIFYSMAKDAGLV